MAKNRQKVDPILDEFKSFNELADFWDAHDLADYEDHLQEVEYQVTAKPTHHFILALSDELTKAMRKAMQSEGVSMQTLVNLWVQDRLQKYQATS